MATPSLILVPSKYKVGTLYTAVATTSSGTVLGSLGDFSVTRASTATRVNNQGFIEVVPLVNNLFQKSEEFDDVYWTKANSTVSGNQTISPLSTNTADEFFDNSTNGRHRFFSQNISFVSGTTYVASIYVKKQSSGRFLCINANSAFNAIGFLNLDTIAVTQGSGTSSVEDIGNGWYRFSVIGTASTSQSVSVLFQMQNTASDIDYVGNGSSFYVFGAQLSTSSSILSYLATTTASGSNSVPRLDYYTSGGTAGCPALLVEPSAQNLVLQSENFGTTWSPVALLAFGSGSVLNTTATLDPYGTNVADLIVANTTGGTQHRVDQTTVSASGSYTFSAFLKAAGYNFGRLRIGSPGAVFNLASGTISATDVGIVSSIQSYGNGWYRCIISKAASSANEVVRINMQPTSSTADFAGDGTSGIYVFGGQYETGSVATSYIPTTTAAVTRNADVISLSGAVSGCIGQASGTIYAEVDYRAFTSTTARRIVSLRVDATTLISLEASVATGSIYVNIVSGASSVTATATGLTNGIYKIAAAYNNDASGTVIYVNGTLRDTKTSVVPDVRTATIGLGVRSDLGSTNQFNDRIRAVALYTTRLPNEELELLTSPTYYSNVRDLIWGTFAARGSTFSELQSCLQTRHNQLITV